MRSTRGLRLVAILQGAGQQAALVVLQREPVGGDVRGPFPLPRRTTCCRSAREYIARLRSGVKGHFSYREIAWEMKRKMEQVEPELGRLMEATPPWVEDPLRR